MAAASSEGSPVTPNTPTILNSTQSERSASRSPSISSVIDEFQWTPLLVSRNRKRKSKIIVKAQGMVEGGETAMEQDMAGAQDTIYLCNFRVSVDGEWLCLKELHDVEFNMQDSFQQPLSTPSPEIPAYPFGRDPVVIERSNLVNISKLVVKELIEQSLRFGRMLDSDHMPLQHFFIVLEHVLRHGLRPKKGLLGPKKELWDILQMVEKYTPEAQDITASVRDLPTVRTHMGRARAWLRLALMQKKLADYLKVLLDHKDEALAEYFEPDALMLSDEAIIIIGLLVGLNVIDCNLCVKEEDLDCPQGVIDFSLYLRSSHQLTGEPIDEQQGDDNMTTVLDQKNYIEELNRHLNATVTNLQTKVESLTTTNALMKEDLAIAKNSLLSLYDENRQLRKELGKEDRSDAIHVANNARLTKISNDEPGDSSKTISRDVSELQQRLEEERKLRQEADKELELQLCIKAEMEVAMKLLEKDIHEKQDTIISLRRQLDDIKLINLEMYKKLQECEMELTQKGEVVSRLQAKAGQIGKILNNLEKYNHLINDSNRDKRSFEKRPTSFDKKFVVTSSKTEIKDAKNSQVAKNSSEIAEVSSSTKLNIRPEMAASKIDNEPSLSKKNLVPVEQLNTDQKVAQSESSEQNSGTVDINQPEECEGSLKHKTELIAKLEAKTQSMSDTIQALEAKYRESEIERTNVEHKRRELDIQAAHHEEQASTVEGDLKVEREWRISLQETMQQDRERISQLQLELTHLKAIAQKYATLQEEYYTLKERWLEQEQTLEELGAHLSSSKMQISDLKEEAGRKVDGGWAKDKTATQCKACSKEFNMTRRKHHCRNCGEIFCSACSDNSMALPSSAKPVRVCDDCHVLLVGRYSVI